jgi:hypothetical protein
MYFNSNFKNNSMINILRIHKLNTTEFIFFFETKCNNSTFADRLFKSVFKHGDLKNMLQKEIKQELTSR